MSGVFRDLCDVMVVLSQQIACKGRRGGGRYRVDDLFQHFAAFQGDQNMHDLSTLLDAAAPTDSAAKLEIIDELCEYLLDRLAERHGGLH
jgi:hypothetical protein